MRIELYDGIGFFLLAGALSLPAVWLGATGRRIRPYGLAATVAMLVAVLKDKPLSLALLAGYFAYELALAWSMLRLASKGSVSKGLGRIHVALAILPLAASKASSVTELGGFAIIGLSYMTFKAVQVIIEIGDGLIKRLDVSQYAYFLLFFPTILCGPIDRSRRFGEDADRIMPKDEYLGLLGDGVGKIAYGAVMKFVIGNLLVLAGTDHLYVYGVYMFFDFAGYSMMAIGLGNVFGIRTPDNFNKPYLSTDMRDFWNRWHISLSTWLRDFVFSRLLRGAMRAKLLGGDRVLQACFCLMVNMLIMGVWHGLEANYILYGLYHGVLLALTELYQKKSKFYRKHRNEKAYKAASWFITINLVMIGFEIFAGHMV